MILCAITGKEGWYVLVRHTPRKAFDRMSFKTIGPFLSRKEATTQGREYAERDREASIRVTYATQVPFAKSVWHRADDLID